MVKESRSKYFQSFDSHREADQANQDFYDRLSQNERLEIALDLMRPYYEAYPRLERILRFADLGECPVSSDRWMGI